MHNPLESVIDECRKRNIPVRRVPYPSNKTVYEVGGFSKASTALLYMQKGKLICETKGSGMEHIDDFHELSLMALEQYIESNGYSESERIGEEIMGWVEHWVEKGIMKKQTRTFYTLK